ncbi:MAG TPA: NADPH:quinone reductase [Thermodesulfobacteriota bacterium]
MRAAWYESVGPARDVIRVGDLPVPDPQPGEVLVRVRASGVNPHDVKKRLGRRAPMEFPRIVPHNDGAGVIERVGPGVPAARVGERVWVHSAQWHRPFGTAAEYAAVPADAAWPLPEGTGFAEGAALGIPAMTAHRAVFADESVYGRRVLVHGGAGAVGYYAIQFAKTAGAEVITTVSSPEKAAVAREAGADHVIDYRREDVARRVRDITRGAGVARIVEVDFGKNLEVDRAVLEPNGVIAAYASEGDPTPALPFYPMMFAGITIRLILVFVMPAEALRRAAADISAMLARGALRHRIAERFPLERIADAHEAVERGAAIGKVVVEVP